MQLNQDIRVVSKFVIELDVEQLAQLQAAIQLAKQKALPGQELFVDVAPHIALRVLPAEQRSVKTLATPERV